MKTHINYSELILKEINDFPEDSLPMILQIINSLKKYYITVSVHKDTDPKSSGLCGIWNDDRSAEEIVKDICSKRTGYGGRNIEL